MAAHIALLSKQSMNHARRGIGLEKKSMDYDSLDSELSKYKAKAAGTAQQLQGS
jgi:hypothetical protein